MSAQDPRFYLVLECVSADTALAMVQLLTFELPPRGYYLVPVAAGDATAEIIERVAGGHHETAVLLIDPEEQDEDTNP
jgi:hypothetical protein